MSSNLDKIIVVGDRVLVQPALESHRTSAGLYLPAGYQDKADVLSGYIIKCGPGYALPGNEEAEEWTGRTNEPRYIPLQVQTGDFALFLQKSAIEVKYDGERYFVVPQNAILLVEREEDFA